MVEEQEERKSLSKERSSLVRQKIIQKEHQIITEEINNKQNQDIGEQTSRLSRRDNFIDQFERNYKHQIFNEIQQQHCDQDIQEKPLDSSKLDELASNQKTFDTNNNKLNLLSNKHFVNTPQTQSDILSINEQLQHHINISQYDTGEQKDKNSGMFESSQVQQDHEISSAQNYHNLNKIFDIQTSKNKQQNLNPKKSFGRQVQTSLQSPEPISLKSSIISQQPSKKSSQKVLQNSSNKKIGVYEKTSGSKVKNNFSKDTQIQDQQLRSSFNDTVKENLKNNLIDAVQNFEVTKDQEKIEDMILELSRLAQKSNGKIPAKQQAQIQKLMNDIELQKLTYSKKQQIAITSPIRSPTLSQSLRGNANGINSQQSSQQKPTTNVNSKILKDIIRHTESKVKQAIHSGKNSLRSSVERYPNPKNETLNLEGNSAYQIFDIENVDQSIELNNNIREKTLDQLKEDLLELLNTLNARVLSSLLRNRGGSGSQVNQIDYEIGYLFALIVSMVDENIPLNNDKSDLLKKSWDDICKYLSNYGRVVYSLQKLRVIFERQDNFLKQFSKLQIQKRFDERQEIFFQNTDKQNVILRFISDLIDLFKLIQKKIGRQTAQIKKPTHKDLSLTSIGFFSPQQTSRVKINFNQPYYKLSPEKSDSPTIPQTTKNQHYQQQYQYQNNSNSRPQSRTNNFSSTKKDKPLTLHQQLLQQKQHAVQKSYQLQLDQSISFRQKADQAKEKELQIAKLKLQQKYLLFQLDKQEQLKKEKLERDKELENMKLQAKFNSYQRQLNQEAVSQERQMIRERSIENQEFKRALRMKDLEDQLRKHREENEKSMQDYQFNLQLQQQKRSKQNEECKRKQQETLIEKVRKSEQFLSQKESELDERLKSQFEQASYRFKKLDETENNIKKELQTLKKIISPLQSKK